jgi:hypothetical protein
MSTCVNRQRFRSAEHPHDFVSGDAALGEPSSGHVGKFVGVNIAEAVRDLLVERLWVHRDSRLGEKTSPEAPSIQGRPTGVSGM